MSTEKKEDIVKKVGKKLIERRKIRNLTLEQVSKALKIRLPFLKALEDGKWDLLPGEVYVKGFLRRYAQYLGLSIDEWIESYFSNGGRSSRQTNRDPSSEASWPSTKRVWIWMAALALILVGVGKMVQNNTAREQNSGPPIPKDVPYEEPPYVPPKDTNDHLAHKLQIFTPYSLWLRVKAEDKNFEGFIPQESTWTWQGNGEFSIRLGHTKQVVMLFDGAAVPLDNNQKFVILPPSNEPR